MKKDELEELVIGMRSDIAYIKEKIDAVQKSCVNINRFQPVEKIVYGFVSLILLSVGGAIIALLFK